jgi:hypothetical protein
MQRGLGFNGTQLLEPRFSRGRFTHSWQECGTIQEFINATVLKDMHLDMWNIKVQQNVDQLAEALISSADYSFPKIDRHRNVFAFRNGLYLSSVQEVLKEPATNDQGQPCYEGRFYSYDQLPMIPHYLSAHKYFDAEFDPFEEEKDWYAIPTPEFQSIIDYQFHMEEHHEGICRVLYMMVGRLLHKAGLMDNWQVWPFLKGCAGTGKSTIITKVVQQMFDDRDVGILSSDSEKQFALSGFINKHVVLSPEMNKQCTFPQALLMSMISCESVSLSEKFKTPEHRHFNVPGIIAGNEYMGQYNDVSGNLARRIVFFNYRRPVPKTISRMDLGDCLKLEIPRLILKCNRAYLEFVNLYQKRDFWSVVPKYFSDQQLRFKKDLNLMMKFLNPDSNSKIRVAAGGSVSLDQLKREFKLYCNTEGIRNPDFSVESLESHLAVMQEKYPFPIRLTDEIRIQNKLDRHILGISVEEIVAP